MARKSDKRSLFDEEDEEEGNGFKINKKYAQQFNVDRERQQLAMLQDKYGDKDDDSESSGSSEDETGKKLPVTFDENFMNVLASIKKKDPKIYDSNHTFFNAETSDFQPKAASKKKEEKKGVFMAAREIELAIKYDGIGVPECVEEKKLKKKFYETDQTLTYVEEQAKLKESLKSALNASDSEEDDLLTKREVSKKEQVKRDKEYTAWKKEELDKKVQKNMKRLLKASRKSSKEDEILYDYVLNKKYVDPNLVEEDEEEEDRIPTYEEITFGADPELLDNLVEQENDDDFEQETLSKKKKKMADVELPDTAEQLKDHRRKVPESFRKKDDSRTTKRLQRKARKDQEKTIRMEELKQLKALKRKEIMEKLERLKKITGNNKMGFDSLDIEGDFDPDQHDQQMQGLFSQDYYGDDEVDEEKPQFSDDEDGEMENWDEWQGNKGETDQTGENQEEQGGNDYNELHCEDPDFIMDCDYDPNAKVADDRKRPGRKRKGKKSSFAKAIEKKKPEFDPSDKAFEEYFDEYYKLDYEDVIGDMPCRFKYRKVVPNDFGLSVEEILAADVKELNKWCPVQRMSQYRMTSEENTDVHRYHQEGSRLERKKKQIFSSLFPSEDGATEEPPKKKSKKARKAEAALGKSDDAAEATGEDDAGEPTEEAESEAESEAELPEAPKKSKKKKRHQNKFDVGYTDPRLEGYLIKPKKFRNKKIFGEKQST